VELDNVLWKSLGGLCVVCGLLCGNLYSLWFCSLRWFAIVAAVVAGGFVCC